MSAIRALNVVVGSVGVVGGLLVNFVAVPALLSLGASVGVAAAVVVLACVAEFVGVGQVLDGLFGRDEDQ